MKIGDYVAKITNEWQKHNKWLEFPDHTAVPLGVIVGGGENLGYQVLTADGTVIEIAESDIKVIK